MHCGHVAVQSSISECVHVWMFTYTPMCDDGGHGAVRGLCWSSIAAAPAGFNLQDNKRCLPLSRPCKSNWRRHYAAVIGSLVNTGGLSKQIFPLRAQSFSHLRQLHNSFGMHVYDEWRRTTTKDNLINICHLSW